MQIKSNKAVVWAAIAALSLGAVAYADEIQDQAAIEDARDTLESFKSLDRGLNQHLMESVAYAVFPNVGKGGFIVAGGKGEGILFERGVPVGTVTTRSVTVGAQVGGQQFSELIIIKSPQALKDFKRGNTELAAGAGAVAGGQSRSKNLEYRAGVAVLTMAKGGLMAEAAVGGQKFEFTPFPTEPKPSL